jgi:hypothetical protein
MPFGWPTPCQPIGCPGVGLPQGVFGVFSYQSIMLILNMVWLTVALAFFEPFPLRSCFRAASHASSVRSSSFLMIFDI